MVLGSEYYITYSPELKIQSLPSIMINDIPLQYVELIKNLVIWLTPTLNYPLLSFSLTLTKLALRNSKLLTMRASDLYLVIFCTFQHLMFPLISLTSNFLIGYLRLDAVTFNLPYSIVSLYEIIIPLLLAPFEFHLVHLTSNPHKQKPGNTPFPTGVVRYSVPWS